MTDSEKLPITGLNPEIKILTRQHDLKEVLVVQEAVLVRVVIVYQLLTVGLSKLYNSIVPQKLQNASSVEVFFGGTVDPHEGGVGAELGVSSAESLPQLLGCQLTLHNFNQHIPE